jgi:hypothetical protein
VLVSTENIYGIFGANFLDFKSLLVLVSRVQHSTDLPRFGVSPSKDFSTGSQSQSMVRSTCDLFQFSLRFRVKELLGYSCRLLNFWRGFAGLCVLYFNYKKWLKKWQKVKLKWSKINSKNCDNGGILAKICHNFFKLWQNLFDIVIWYIASN